MAACGLRVWRVKLPTDEWKIHASKGIDMCGPPPMDPDDIVSPFCRVCDYNPCMCGSRKYQTDREARDEYNKECEARAEALREFYPD